MATKGESKMAQAYKSPIDLSNDLVNKTHKRFEFDPYILRALQRSASNNFLMKDYKLEDIDIDQVAQDNDLDNDTSMAERRPQWWGNDINKYTIDPDRLRWSYDTDPIRIKVGQDGKYRIADGHHRLKALKNMGYTQVPAFVLKE